MSAAAPGLPAERPDLTRDPDQQSTALRATARGGAGNVLGAATSAILNFLIVVAVTRGFDKTTAGFVFTATAVFVLVEAVVKLGTDIGIVHFVSTARARQQPERVAQVLWASLVPVAAASVVGAVLTVIFAPTLMRALGTAASSRHAVAIVVVVAVGIPIAAIYDSITAATRGLGSARPTVLIERILRPVLQGAGVLAAALAGASSVVIVIAWVAPYVLVLPVMVGWLLRLLRPAGIRFYSSQWPEVFGEVWRFTLPRTFSGIIQVLLQRLDIILVGAFLGAPSAAVYTGATRFVVVGQLGNQGVAFAFQPQLARLVATRQLDDARDLYRLSSAWIAGLTAPLYLAVCVTSPWLINILGHGYRSGLAAMIVVTGAMLIGNACGLVDLVLITMGRTSWNLANSAAALTLNIGLDVLLIPRIGIIGAAIGWAVAIIANNLVPVLQVRHAYRFSPVSGIWVRLLLSVAVLFGALPGLALILSGSNSIAVVVALVVGGGLYAAILWRSREQLGLHDVIRRRPGASAPGGGVSGSGRPEVAIGGQGTKRVDDV
jgi:O-antigen/teichoic acid export membrane protein